MRRYKIIKEERPLRRYKIIKEERPSEKFTRWIPMVANGVTYDGGCETGEVVDDSKLWIWKLLPYGVELNNIGYCKTLPDAKRLIDAYELYMKEQNGDFIIDEIEYKPNR